MAAQWQRAHVACAGSGFSTHPKAVPFRKEVLVCHLVLHEDWAMVLYSNRKIKDIKNPKASCCPTLPPLPPNSQALLHIWAETFPSPSTSVRTGKLLRQQLTASAKRDISQPPCSAGSCWASQTGIKPQPKTERREPRSFPPEKIRRSQGVGTLGMMEAEGGARAEELVRKARLNTRATSCGLVCPTPGYTASPVMSKVHRPPLRSLASQGSGFQSRYIPP